MIEIKWYARGGQGGFTASRLAGLACAGQDKYAQAFPSFGPERRGAPVYGFTRVDEKPIRNHSQIYACDYAIVLDATLMETIDVTQGLKPGGSLFLNAPAGLKVSFPENIHVYRMDASALALEILGADIANTAMLAFFCAKTGLCTLERVQKALEEGMPAKLAARNMPLVQRVYGSIGEEVQDVPAEAAEEKNTADAPQRAPSVSDKPQIREFPMPENFEELPFGPSSPAGVLTQGNAGWRVFSPAVDHDKCVHCMLCWTYCPDGVIDRDINIDMNFCKGCGICARECPKGAITMRREENA